MRNEDQGQPGFLRSRIFTLRLRGASKTFHFPRALLLLPLGDAAMWLANIASIALLVAVRVWIVPAVAAQGFHSQAGWLAFIGIALGLVVGSRRIRFFTRTDPRADRSEYTNSTAVYLVPLLTIIATTMITGPFSSGFDRFDLLRVLVAAVAAGISGATGN